MNGFWLQILFPGIEGTKKSRGRNSENGGIVLNYDVNVDYDVLREAQNNFSQIWSFYISFDRKFDADSESH